MALSACGSDGNSSTTASSDAGSASTSGASSEVTNARAEVAKFSGEVSSYPEVPPLKGAGDLRGKTVWYVPIGAGPASLNTFGTGIKQALREVGATLEVCDGKFLPTGIASCLNQAKSRGADAVVTGYVDYSLVPRAFDNLVSSGIPVLVAGSAPPKGKTSSPKLAWFDTTGTSRMKEKLMMDALIADSGGKAKVLYVGVTDSPQLIDEAGYAVSYLKAHCSGCSVHRVDVNTASLSKLASQVSSALISNSDTTYVVNEIDPYVEQTTAGIQSAGFTNKVKLTSTDGDLPGLQQIKSGSLHTVDVGFSTIYSGWQWGDAAMRMLRGDVPKSNLSVFRVFTKDNVGDLTLTPKAYETGEWFGPKDFRPTFRSAWGLK